MPERPSSNFTSGFDVLDAASGVQRVDQPGVFLRDESAPHLARARQLVIVRVELLVQYQEAAHLRIGEPGSPASSAFTFSTQPRISS